MPNKRKPVSLPHASIAVGALIPWIIAFVSLAILPAPNIRSAIPQPGTLIKGSGSTVYYHARDGKRYVFPNTATYATWYRDFSSVQLFDDTQLAAIPLGGNVTYRPGTRMIKVQSDPKVYAVDARGTLRWITTEAIARTLYGSQWTRLVDDLPDAFFVNYRVGDAITSASAFDPTRAATAATSIDSDRGIPSRTPPTTPPPAEGAPNPPTTEPRREPTTTPSSTETSRTPPTRTSPGVETPPTAAPSTAPAGTTSAVPADFTIAFFGDQSVLPEAESVLQLIKQEGTDLVLHVGDFDYLNAPAQWEAMVNRILGPDFPYLAVIGDHDVNNWSGYAAKLQARLAKMTDASCTGTYGIRSTCTYKGFTIVGTGGFHTGTGTQDPGYIHAALAGATTSWRICMNHQSLRYIDQLVQVYDECRKGGAIMAGAHEHLYLRSHLVSDFVQRTIADRGNILPIDLGRTVAFIVGLGGKSTDDLRDGLYVPRDWWAVRYTRAEQAKPGALLCTFNPGGTAPNRANCAFKDIGGKTADTFTLVTNIAGGTGGTLAPSPTPTESRPPTTEPPSGEGSPREAPPSPVPLPPTPPPTTNGGPMTIGTNISEHRYWSGSWLFTNVFKMSIPWISGEVGGCWQFASNIPGCTSGPSLALDADHWVKSLQADAGHGKAQAANTIILGGTGNIYPSGTYAVYFDGTGLITYGGTGRKNVSLSRPGHDVVDVDGSKGGNFTLSIAATDPSNPIRNIRAMMPGGACTTDPAQYCTTNAQCGSGGSCELFADHPDQVQLHPYFLANIKPFSIVRFMDLMGTNAAPFRSYGDYSQVTDAQWPEIPADIIAQIANTGVDPWVTIPHKADNAFVRSFAQALKDTLRPERKVYVEYSNEVWNPGFSQIADVAVAGCQRNTNLQSGCDQDANPGNGRYCEGFPSTWNQTCGTAYRREFSERSVEIWDIFTQVFGGTSRLVRVMGSQIGQPALHADLLTWKNAAQKTDALAVAPYVGGEIGGNAAAITWSVDRLFQELTNVSLPLAFGRIDKDAQYLRQNFPSIALIAYEGGQHLVGLTKLAPDGQPFRENAQMTNLFLTANHDPRMGTLYNQYLAGLAARGVTIFNQFNLAGRWTKYGSWGAKENEDRTRAASPKYDALVRYIEGHPVSP